MWLLPSPCCHCCPVAVQDSLTQKEGRSCWLEINSCHGTLDFQPGTTGKLLPCFPNSLFAHLTWQTQHKPGKQKRFPGHIMGEQTSCRCLHSPSSPPAFPSSPPGLPLLHPLVELSSLGQWWSPTLCLHNDHLLFITSTHLIPQQHREEGSYGFYIHDIPILYLILSVIQRDDQKGTTTPATNSITESITVLWKAIWISFSRAKLWGGDQTKPAILLGEGSMPCSV